MAKNMPGQDQFHELHINAEKIASMQLEEFQKIPSSNVQALLHDIVQHAEQSEKENEALQKTNAELAEFRRQYTDLYEVAPVGYINLNERGIIVKVNITARDMLNKSKEELLNLRFVTLISPPDQETFAAYLAKILETGSRMSIEVRMRRGDGTAFFAQLQTLTVKEQSNVAYRVSMADITDRKQAENMLKENEEKYRMLFESMEEGYAFCEMIHDENGNPVDFRYLAVNPAFADLTGLPVERVVGRTVRELIPGIEFFWIETYNRVVQTGRSEKIENYVAELEKYYDVHAWRSGPKRFSVVFNDVTERRLRELKSEKTFEKTPVSGSEVPGDYLKAGPDDYHI